MTNEEIQLLSAVERAARQCVHGQVALPPSQWALDRLQIALDELDAFRSKAPKNESEGHHD